MLNGYSYFMHYFQITARIFRQFKSNMEEMEFDFVIIMNAMLHNDFSIF